MDRVHHGVRPVGARIYEAISLELVRARRTKGRVGVTETGRLSESFGCLVPREGDALRIGRRCQCELSGDVILGQGHAALRGEAIFGLAEDTRPTLAKGGRRYAREAILAGACPPRGGETHGRDEPGPGCHRVRECSAARRDRASSPGARGFARIRGARPSTCVRVLIARSSSSRGVWRCATGRTLRRSSAVGTATRRACERPRPQRA